MKINPIELRQPLYSRCETHLTLLSRATMEVWTIGAAAFCVLIFGGIATRRLRAKRRIEASSIEPEALYELLHAKEVLLYDVRQPLDFLAHPEIIPGATRN